MTRRADMSHPVPCPTCGVEARKLEAEIERLRGLIASQSHAAEKICGSLELETEIERLRAALKPFAQKADGFSLSHALGHITREHLLEARRALEEK